MSPLAGAPRARTSRDCVDSGPASAFIEFAVFDQPIAMRPIRSNLHRRPPRRLDASLLVDAFLLAAALAVLLGYPWGTLSAAPPDSDQPVEADPSAATDLRNWQANGLPLMQTYCADCHNQDTQEGGLDLSPYETLKDVSAAEVKRLIEMVRFGAMPPEDSEPLKIEERKQLVSALESALYSSTCDLTPRAGKVTVRRMNRSEYNNTIRDLFGMDLRPADSFPSDEVGAGFDNNGDVLSLSPMLIEKYIEAAESVSRQVIVDPADLPEIDLDVPGDQIPVYGEPKIGRFNGRFLDSDSFAWLDIEVPFDGQYDVSVRGGTTSQTRGRTKVAICDGQGTVLAIDDLQYYGGGGSSDSMSETIELPQGKHRLVFIPVLNDAEIKTGETQFAAVGSMAPDRVQSILARRGKPVSPDDRIDPEEHPFMFRSFEINGPKKHPASAFPPQQFNLVKHVAPRKRGGYQDVEIHAIKNLVPLMRSAFRSPVSEDEARPYAGLVEQAVKESKSFHRGMQIALSAVLVSPRFLFRVEMPDEATEPNELGDVPLSPHQLATRLSYFLWSSTPDSELLEQADRNQLTVDQLKTQIERMLNDPKADAMGSDFAAQWLGLRNLNGHEADDKRFPEFDDQLKSSMARETELFFLHVLRNNLPVREFLTADYTFVNAKLAQHYGVNVSGEGYEKVSLAETPRRGLLAHASVLTLTSTPNRTSPVLRGKWILENVLGTPAPDPPAGVPGLEEAKTASENATLREQFELHRTSPTCASCHRVMDQLGFGLDDFDAIGRYRSEDAGQPIDASGALPDGREFNGGIQLSQMLAATETDGLARTLTERMLTFAIGRELTPDDRCTIDEIVAKTKPNQYRLVDIVTEIVTSRPFRFQTIDSQVAAP